MKRIALRALATAAVAFLVSAGSGTATTQPQTTHFAIVHVTDTSIVLGIESVPRGAIVIFTIDNRSHHARNFALGGYRTGYIKPGGKARFQLNFLYRGKYACISVGKGGKRLTAAFRVT